MGFPRDDSSRPIAGSPLALRRPAVAIVAGGGHPDAPHPVPAGGDRQRAPADRRIDRMSLLPDAESFKQLVDGTDTAARARLARLALTPLGGLWSTVMTLRNGAYDRGWLPAVRAAAPVVCVGNLTLGGTGKTPLVAWVARRLLAAGRRPAIVSRGYAAAAGQRSDEAAELAILLPGILHVADRDRAAAAAEAVAAGADAIVLDDGFQHRRLARDLDLVAVDATDPFGCGHVFPRGLLRERIDGLARADATILTRAGSVSATRRGEIRDRLSRACRGALPRVWAEASHAPVALRDESGTRHPIDRLHGRRVAAFAGIGNPSAFRRTLASLGAEVVAFRPYADHHAYTRADLADLAGWAAGHGAEGLVTTLKDLVKIPAGTAGAIELTALEIALVVESGAAELGALVDRVVEARGPGAGEMIGDGRGASPR